MWSLRKEAYALGGHRELTEKALANLKERGITLTPSQVERLIKSNEEVDWENAKYLTLSPRRSPFHAHVEEEGVSRGLINDHFNKAVKDPTTDGALDALGIALHTTQDMQSHEAQGVHPGLRGLTAHLPFFGDPDSLTKHPENTDRAVRASEKLIASFIHKREQGLDKVRGLPLQYHAVMEKAAQVSPYQQKTQHTCSAACLVAVLTHYGFEADEHDVSGIIGVRQKGGAETTQIAEAARRLGLDAFEYSFSSLEQASVLTEQDIPIIADIQSFKHPGSGHYVVITKIDDHGVHLMDPNVDGNVRTISHEEMDSRWWDRAMKPPHPLMPKWGVVVLPPEKS